MTSLNWDLDEAPPASASAPPVSTPTGKFSSLSLGAGGGGLSGRAQLTLLKFADCVPQEGGNICTYVKGRDKRTFCLTKDCTKTTHKNATKEKRVKFADGVDELLIIQTSPDTGLTTPTMHPNKLGRSLERYLVEDRSIDAWVALFEQTEQLGLTEEEVGLVASSLDDKQDDRMIFTPWKRRKVLKSVAPSPSESISSFQDITFVPPMEELGGMESPNLILSNLTTAWPGLVRNLTTIHEMVAAAKKGNKELSDAFDDELQNLGGQLLLIISKLGDRTGTFNGASTFEMIASLDKEVNDVMDIAESCGGYEYRWLARVATI
jgi:hypothetical protein